MTFSRSSAIFEDQDQAFSRYGCTFKIKETLFMIKTPFFEINGRFLTSDDDFYDRGPTFSFTILFFRSFSKDQVF